MVAGASTPTRNQPERAFTAMAENQQLDLPTRYAESLVRPPRHQAGLSDRLDDLQPVQFAHAHGEHAGIGHRRLRG